MFKFMYGAGRRFAEETLPALAAKTPWGKNAPEEKTKAGAGVLSMGLGGIVENVSLFGMILTGVVAVGIAMSTGVLTVPAFAGLFAVGTAFAGAGTFGRGMIDGGDTHVGILAMSRQLRGALFKAAWNDLRGKKVDLVAAAPAADAEKPFSVDPASAAFSKALTSPQAEQPAAQPSRAPEQLKP